MPEVTVIADDLTGAADCGIAFTVAGLPTFVAFGDGPAPASASIVARDTDSRRLPEPEAAQRALAAARQAYLAGSRTVYRKIDSTLRGNVGAETAATYRAAAEAGGTPPLVIASPAFPATGRIVREGRVLVNGVPLEQTEVWRKSGTSGPADLLAMLRGAGLQAAVVRGDAVRAGADALARTLSELAGRGVQAVVCDAEDEADLQRIAEAGARLARPIVWAGSAGLARKLPAALGLRAAGGPAAAAPPRPSAPVLVLVGSRSTVAREQAQRVSTEAGVVTLTATPDALLEPSGGARGTELGRALHQALASGHDVLLLIGLEPIVALERGLELAERLATLVAAEAGALGGLVATGGDVARTVLGALGATGLHLLGEVEPGVPLGLTDTSEPVRVVTKAGAFGDPNTLLRARAALRR
jgi:D-threonate/D-erythronate kinase